MRDTDKDLGYLQGTNVFSRMQKAMGGSFLFVFFPRSEIQSMPNYRYRFDEAFGNYILENGGHYTSSLLDLKMRPQLDTYDGGHQTIFGNQRIARALFEVLKDQKLIY